MKAIITLSMLVMCLSLFAQIAVAPANGNGNPDNPFQLSSFNNLVWLMQTPSVWSFSFIQTDNIDASASSELDSGAGWTPIGNGGTLFTGSYDGQGFEIQGLYLSLAGSYYTGFFGYVNNAKLNRIHLRNINIRGFVYSGGLAGVATGSVINNCSATGNLIANTDVGGLLGFANHNTVVTNCYAGVTVQGSENVGGLVGQNGFNNAYYYRCYSTGQVNGGATWYQGGFVGRHSGGAAKYCYWDTQSSYQATSQLGTPKTTAEMKQQSCYETWNFSTQWSIAEGISYPNLSLLAAWSTPQSLSPGALSGSGTQSDPYRIYNASHFNVIRQAPDAWFRLYADIDLSSSVVWNHGMGWLPVGSASAPFTGNLDGNGFKLINLVINRPQTDYTAIFAYTQNAAISDLLLQNARLLGKNYCATLIADANGGTITDVNANCQIVAASYAGGLCGRMINTLMTRCRAEVSIPSANDYVGGLVGIISSSGSITGSISESFSTGNIYAGWNIGGVAGALLWGYINDCYSHVSVYGGRIVGGVAGLVGGSNPGYLNRCYGAGAVTLSPGGTFSGGVAGYMSDGSTYSASYWDINTTGIPNDIHNNGRTHAQMIYPGSQTTFATWDFASIWRHDSAGNQNNGYPYLAWQQQLIPGAVQFLVISHADNQVQLSWQPVAGVSHYRIYASTNPNDAYENWTYIGQSSESTFVTDTVGNMRFYMVRSVQE